MITQGVQPKVISYSVSITSCGRGLEWEKALELLREMKTQSLQLNIISYTSLISISVRQEWSGRKHWSYRRTPKLFAIFELPAPRRIIKNGKFDINSEFRK